MAPDPLLYYAPKGNSALPKWRVVPVVVVGGGGGNAIKLGYKEGIYIS